MLSLEELGEQAFALLNRLAAQIPAIKLKQIESAQDRTCERTMAADQIKHGKAVLVADNRLPINQA